jgi:thioesterase domain-containing protein
VPGELYVGGASVGRGYLDRPELTAERFVPDALGGVPGARLYRTGDRVRWLADGSMEFLGRLDSQLKVRGYRVEPGEVTAVLRTHPAVRDCVVLGREEAGRQLVAYVVGREALEEAELREYLEQRLPEYMVPSAFVVLEALPLTPNGKVDGKALPAPARGEAEASFVAPRGETQQRLAGLWQELLAVERVGARDDFFALGGHSLLATRLMARIHDTFGAGLAVIDLFEAPTLERLAERIDTGTRSTSPLVALRKGGARPPFFCVHPVGGSVLCYLELARRLAPEQPFYGVQVPALEEGQAPDGTVEQMAARYVEALRGVQPRGPYLLGGWSFGGRVAYEMARRLTQQGEQVALLALIDAHGWGDSLEPDGGDAPEGQVLRFAEYLSRLSGVHGRAMEVLGQVDLQELRAVLEERPEAETGLPPESCEELRAVWRVFSRNLRASRQYVPQPFSGPLVLLRAGDVPAGDAGLAEDLGWAALAEGGVEVRQVPGDHYSLVTVPHVERLAEELQALLDRARAPGHGRQAL